MHFYLLSLCNELRSGLYLEHMKRIMLATPSLELTEKYRDAFSSKDILIEEVSTGTEAQQQLEHSRFNLVVAEFDLPGVTGEELCCFIKEKDPDIHVLLACSGKKSELKVCGRCGADAHLQTPIDQDDLFHRVSYILKVPAKRATRVLVKVKVNSTVQSEPFFSISHNISLSGMMIEAEQSLAMGDIISCSFYLPEAERFMATSRVVRIVKPSGSNHQYGVEFLGLDEENRNIIDGFIKQEREAGNFF